MHIRHMLSSVVFSFHSCAPNIRYMLMVWQKGNINTAQFSSDICVEFYRWPSHLTRASFLFFFVFLLHCKMLISIVAWRLLQAAISCLALRFCHPLYIEKKGLCFEETGVGGYYWLLPELDQSRRNGVKTDTEKESDRHLFDERALIIAAAALETNHHQPLDIHHEHKVIIRGIENTNIARIHTNRLKIIMENVILEYCNIIFIILKHNNERRTGK